MKIGIVGSGIAGLTAAYLLQKDGFHVTLFERQSQFGMAAHCIEFDGGYYGDVPSRMFNPLQWPTLVELYHEIGVEYQPVNPTQSFRQHREPNYLTLDIANRPSLAKTLLTNSFARKTISSVKRLQAVGEKDLTDGLPDDLDFQEYLRMHKFDSDFINRFLFPTLSTTVLTCSYAALRNYPARWALGILKNLFDSPDLYRTSHGTRDVVTRLTDVIKDVRLSTQVDSINQAESECVIRFGGEMESFDHVVVCVQANHVSTLVSSLASGDVDVFSDVKYENVDVIVHKEDAADNQQNDWSTFNMISNDQFTDAMCTVWMNRFQDWDGLDVNILQTINPLPGLEIDNIVSQTRLQRPLITKSSRLFWRRIDEWYAESDRRVWFCGSYASPGVPLLETGVQSAKRVTASISERRNALV